MSPGAWIFVVIMLAVVIVIAIALYLTPSPDDPRDQTGRDPLDPFW